jgi:hypothetical protein
MGNKMKKSELRKLVREIIEIVEDEIPGGKGDNLSSTDLDQTELQKGIKVETEHTNDPVKAEEIAKDHLAEDPQYYTKLEKAGLADELTESRVGDAYIEIGEAIEAIDDELVKISKMIHKMGDYGRVSKHIMQIKNGITRLKNELGDLYDFKP